MRQFLEIKARYPDAILMFRMGDFYEMFFDDALEVAPVLDIAVTSRDKGAEDPVPMAGVPYHALGGYLRTLVERGMKVAICEQMETPEEARKRKGNTIVRREVVRVVTPGALVDDEHLRSEEPNYLAAVVPEGALPGPCGVALYDISSGDFVVLWAPEGDTVRAELARLGPKEVLADDAHHTWLGEVFGPDRPRLDIAPPPAKEVLARVRALADESGLPAMEAVVEQAAARVLEYAEGTQPGQTLLLHRIRRHEPARHLVLDDTSIRNLELYRTLRDGVRRGSVLWAIDGTKTAMGARMLRAWLGAPSRDRSQIAARHDSIEALLVEPRLRAELQSRLKDVRDVVRLAARARLGTVSPRELGALRSSLVVLPDLQAFLTELAVRRTDRTLPGPLSLGEDLLEDLLVDLQATLVDIPPAVVRDGGVIREGADAFLDEQRRLRDGGREALAAIETRERERTQIASLKVQHNRVFGYYLEVPRAHLARVPQDYVRKQTLATAERYVTEELAGHESRVLGAQAQALTREQQLFTELRTRVSAQGERLSAVGERLATLDVLSGLAEVAERHGYCRPVLVEEPVLEIEDGRHPVVERMLQSGRFVPNDVRLDARATAPVSMGAGRLWMITGPNMGGKSTMMRQSALIAILAHIGSYVPARSATIGLVDRVFTRVGAADDLGGGDSTFMVEMRDLDVRWARSGLGDHRVLARSDRLPGAVRHPLPRAVRPGRGAAGDPQRSRDRARAAGSVRVPAPARRGSGRSQLRGPGRPTRRSSGSRAPPGDADPRASRSRSAQRQSPATRPVPSTTAGGRGGTPGNGRRHQNRCERCPADARPRRSRCLVAPRGARAAPIADRATRRHMMFLERAGSEPHAARRGVDGARPAVIGSPGK
jgi:DNA mismatch repair protein MutS